VLGTGMILPVVYLIWSMRYGRVAPANPWMLPGLEWRTSSPPPTENFVATPVVTWEAYEFAPPEELRVIGKFEPDDAPDHPIVTPPVGGEALGS